MEFVSELQELEAIKARVREMEEEAEKLKELQNEVEKQMNLSPPPGMFFFFFYLALLQDADLANSHSLCDLYSVLDQQMGSFKSNFIISQIWFII